MLGAVPTEQDVDFNGIVILRVAPQPESWSRGTPLMASMVWDTAMSYRLEGLEWSDSAGSAKALA